MAAIILRGGSLWRRWLRHCATSRKGAGSFPDLLNPSGHTMALGSTQPVTEMMLRGVKAAGAQVDNIVTFFISVFSLWYHHTYRCDDTRVMQF